MKAVKMPKMHFSSITPRIRTLFRCETGGGRKDGVGAPLLLLTVFLSGLLMALCFCWMLETYIMSRALEERLALAERISGRAPSFANAGAGFNLDELAAANPFGASLPPKEEKNGPSAHSVSSFVLAGTLPDIGAWIRDDEGTHLVLKGQKIKGYEVADVAYGRVLLSANGESHPLYLKLSGGSAPPPPPAPVRPVSKTGHDLSGVIAAGAGREGAVPRELVDKLLMNPYDEIAKMRMVPVDGGMQLQRIAPDSVLAAVGVAQGDIVKAINGVNIGNLSDVSNAVNSLMSGTRFDVTVSRNGKPLDLKYQVK